MRIPYIYPLCFDKMNPSFFPNFSPSPFTYQFYMFSPKNKTKPKKELSAYMCMSEGLPMGACTPEENVSPAPSPATVSCQYILARVNLMSPSPVLTSSCACGPKQCQFICANGALVPSKGFAEAIHYLWLLQSFCPSYDDLWALREKVWYRYLI